MNKANAAVRTYSWGPEAQGAPGTLRMIADNNGVYFPAYDPNGNVMGLVKASDGTVCAQYEYLPYGELVTATGTIASSNPIRFSTKYRDNETGLYYYGYRYYLPDMGRWLSRDPIEEQGGLNLYGFVNNDPVNHWDLRGKMQDEYLFYKSTKRKSLPNLKECGYVISRAIEIKDSGSNSTKWDIFHEAVSMIYYPHVFLILEDGSRLTHGGNTEGLDHWTARAWPIYIPKCADCKEFTKCVKEHWPNNENYTWYWDNCQKAVNDVLNICGAVRKRGSYWGIWE